jgi:site-specific recombinase XerC
MLWAGGEEMAPSSLHLTDGVPSIAAVQPVHVSTWIEASTRELDAPSVKPRLAALRHLFDWLVNGQVVPVNPAHTVRGLRHVVRGGKTPVTDGAAGRRPPGI